MERRFRSLHQRIYRTNIRSVYVDEPLLEANCFRDVITSQVQGLPIKINPYTGHESNNAIGYATYQQGFTSDRDLYLGLGVHPGSNLWDEIMCAAQEMQILFPDPIDITKTKIREGTEDEYTKTATYYSGHFTFQDKPRPVNCEFCIATYHDKNGNLLDGLQKLESFIVIPPDYEISI